MIDWKPNRPARESRAVLLQGLKLPCLLRSMRQRIGTQLQLHELRHVALADAFAMERRAVAGAGPHAAALPAAVGIIDAAVDELGEEAHRVWHHEVDHLAVLERDERLVLVAGRERHVLAE